jgi:cytochrome c oxidase cbb3-type subunit 2
MNSGPLVFLGTFFAVAVSWLGFVLAPQLQIGGQRQVESKSTGELYPSMRPGLARQGEQIYRANGCFYCHSEQVRPKGFGADYNRQWGARNSSVQSVDQDYLYDYPVMLGNQRVGPDLANIGARQTNASVLLAHIYNPRATMPGSVMPPYRYLFVKHKLGFNEKPSPDALQNAGVPDGYEVVPTADARALAAYLISLHADAILYETPPFPQPKKPGAATNAVAAAGSSNATAAVNAGQTNSKAK